MILQRCPRCLDGRVYGGFIKMNDECPLCGYAFGHEEGYFTGAMYISYLIGLGLMLGIVGILWPFWPTHSIEGIWVLLLVASVGYFALVPLVFRYSRVVWMHLDYVATVRRSEQR
jgi:uncharacterized protein (DUF983 family)